MLGTCVECKQTEKQVKFVKNKGTTCEPCMKKKPGHPFKEDIGFTQEIFIVGDLKKVLEKEKPVLKLIDMYQKRRLKRQERVAFFQDLIDRFNRSINMYDEHLIRFEKRTILSRALQQECFKGKKVEALGMTEDGILRAKIGGIWYAKSYTQGNGTAELIEVSKVMEKRASQNMIRNIQI